MDAWMRRRMDGCIGDWCMRVWVFIRLRLDSAGITAGIFEVGVHCRRDGICAYIDLFRRREGWLWATRTARHPDPYFSLFLFFYLFSTPSFRPGSVTLCAFSTAREPSNISSCAPAHAYGYGCNHGDVKGDVAHRKETTDSAPGRGRYMRIYPSLFCFFFVFCALRLKEHPSSLIWCVTCMWRLQALLVWSFPFSMRMVLVRAGRVASRVFLLLLTLIRVA